MATGKIKSTYPPGNNGSKPGAGQIVEDGTGTKYVFHTPDDCTAPLAVGDVVEFTIGSGNSVSGVAKPVMGAIRCTLSFSQNDTTITAKTVAVGDAVSVFWTSVGADGLTLDNLAIGPVSNGEKPLDTNTKGLFTHTLVATNGLSGDPPATAKVVLTVQ